MTRTPTARIGVLGTGYLGSTHAVCMAMLGHDVLATDVDHARLAALRSGQVPFHEPGLPELLRKALDSGRLTGDVAEVAAFADVHFLCTGTPQLPGSDGADLSQVLAAVDGLAPYLRRPCLVVGKSTVPVGTAAHLAQRLAERAPVRAAAELAWAPEFLREGHAIDDTLTPSRLVFGVGSPEAELRLREVFAPVIRSGAPVVTTDLATAELTKVAANAFLATKISFVNAMSEVCDGAGGDVVDLARPGARRADRRALPAARARLRRRLPAQGHPRLRAPGRPAGVRRGGLVPARRRRDQPAVPRACGLAGPGGGRGRTGGRQGGGAGRRPSSPRPTTSATLPRCTSPAGCTRPEHGWW